MFYCIELQIVLKTSTLLNVDKLIVFKRTPWTGAQIRKLDITTMFFKTTFKKFYKSDVVPVQFSADKSRKYFTRSYSYVKYTRLFKAMIKHTAEFRLAQ
jgi:hypothetical protein